MSVRRSLFDIQTVKSSADFKALYTKMFHCSSFECLQDLFSRYEIGPLVGTFPQVKVAVDRAAVASTPKNFPRGFMPHITIGDGNCVARSLATLVYGDENKYHLEMRVRLVHELVVNVKLYLDPLQLSVGCTNVDPSRILSEMVELVNDLGSEESFDDPEQVVKGIIFRSRILTKDLTNFHLHAAANILRLPIVAIYPDRGPARLRNLMKRAFMPDVLPDDCQTLYVMWYSTRNDMNDEYWIPNHMVPLVKIHK